MDDFWSKYTGLTRRAVVKRSGAELVAEKERAALAEMTGRQTPTAKSIKDAILERLRAYEAGVGDGYEKPEVTIDANGRLHAKVTLPESLRETPSAPVEWALHKPGARPKNVVRVRPRPGEPTITMPCSGTVIESGVDSEGFYADVEPALGTGNVSLLPELRVGMRVRNLDPESRHFGKEGTVGALLWDKADGRKVPYPQIPPVREFVVETEGVLRTHAERMWLSTFFPADESLLPMAADMRVALSLDKNGSFVKDVVRVEKGTIERMLWRNGWGEGHLDGDGHSYFCIALTMWLRRAWPLLRGDNV